MLLCNTKITELSVLYLFNIPVKRETFCLRLSTKIQKSPTQNRMNHDLSTRRLKPIAGIRYRDIIHKTNNNEKTVIMSQTIKHGWQTWLSERLFLTVWEHAWWHLTKVIFQDCWDFDESLFNCGWEIFINFINFLLLPNMGIYKGPPYIKEITISNYLEGYTKHHIPIIIVKWNINTAVCWFKM